VAEPPHSKMENWNYFNYFTEIENISGGGAGAPAGVAAGLGDHGDVQKAGCRGGGAEGDRPGV